MLRTINHNKGGASSSRNRSGCNVKTTWFVPCLGDGLRWDVLGTAWGAGREGGFWSSGLCPSLTIAHPGARNRQALAWRAAAATAWRMPVQRLPQLPAGRAVVAGCCDSNRGGLRLRHLLWWLLLLVMIFARRPLRRLFSFWLVEPRRTVATAMTATEFHSCSIPCYTHTISTMLRRKKVWHGRQT